ncbi:MAG TPA: lysophospholipid acyltransferase family protein [Smithellaceae bacterium]|jgi:1-acyl-sn-glycerol-3-phosphate acyltransferase|nr:lysophospholipid acyltransferase family protein [Smithellaceae bacterium]HPL96174.1 lysophospholipid acyltransferase family protein [Smithellaceae bacterium]HQF83393.1 lysophospholipid acyltransferase family protein [Smithellaceae bacterium]HQG80113.1 lysophospholipid acyltransferase family protein [Smithellaceae bacterium]
MLGHFVSALFLIFVSITSIPLFLIALILRLVTYPFDRRLRLLHLFTCFWASIYTWIMPPWRIRIEGREHVRKNATYMVVSNHQSQLDILVAFRLFFHYKWVSKVEMFRIPLIGWNMMLNRYIRLKRGDRKSVEQMLRACEVHLDEGSSVFMFPEGTRSPDGEVKVFKPGAFQLALEKKVPVLPIVISGTNKALPKYSMKFTGVQKIYIKIFEEIPYEAFKNLSVEETAEMVRRFIIDKLNVMNGYTLDGPPDRSG